MDVEIDARRSLPPLVEGQVQGYLELLVDEVIWIREPTNKIVFLACWWGDKSNAVFR